MPKVHRLIDDPQLEPFYRGVDEFCDQMLDHRQTLGDEDASSAKMFADPLEGYIGLAGWEVAIVDSPLFQRLRDIHQLGLAYLVYPTLGYTRFEHSLGVVGRLKQVLDHLEENQRLYKRHAKVGELLPDDHRNAVRLAALCHDTGHCIFSHVSEAVMSHLSGHDGYPSASVILKAFHDYAGRSVPAAELLGAAIVASQPFVKFLSNVVYASIVAMLFPGARRGTRAGDKTQHGKGRRAGQ